MSWLVVTPARNEAAHLPRLAASLAAQSRPDLIGLWVVVDDGSTDGTAAAVDWPTLPFQATVVRRDEPAKGLRGGGAFDAFYAGADAGLREFPGATRVLKLDADMVLEPTYVERLAADGGDAALIGGVLVGRAEREQAHHVRGSLKAHRRDTFDTIIRSLPAAAGHDVLDEVALRRAGHEVRVVQGARARVQRTTSSSEGMIAGRMRNGMVSKWTGYHGGYFALRLLRYAFRRPVVLGSVAMLIGWLRAGTGPYEEELRGAHHAEQAGRLRQLRANPVRYLRRAFA